jgi:holin-like protein
MADFGIPYPKNFALRSLRAAAISIASLAVLAGLALAGDALSAAGHLPLPGPLLGTVLLVAWLCLRPGDARRLPAADWLIRLMPLLFVPLLVEAVAPLRALGRALPAVVFTVCFATVVSLAVTVAAARLTSWLSSRSR